MPRSSESSQTIEVKYGARERNFIGQDQDFLPSLPALALPKVEPPTHREDSRRLISLAMGEHDWMRP